MRIWDGCPDMCWWRYGRATSSLRSSFPIKWLPEQTDSGYFTISSNWFSLLSSEFLPLLLLVSGLCIGYSRLFGKRRQILQLRVGVFSNLLSRDSKIFCLQQLLQKINQGRFSENGVSPFVSFTVSWIYRLSGRSPPYACWVSLGVRQGNRCDCHPCGVSCSYRHCNSS